MHLKVFLKLKNPFKLSLLGKYIKKTNKKTKNQKKQKTPLGWFFLKNPDFSNPGSGWPSSTVRRPPNGSASPTSNYR
jgi:hypothetical protein